MNGNILIAVDGSPESDNALIWVMENMKPGASIFAVYVIAPSKYAIIEGAAGYEGIPTLHEVRERIITEEKERVIARVHELSADRGIHVEMLVRVGDPRNEFLKTAEEHKSDTIVVGSTGKGLGTRLLLGSVSTYVVTHASVTTIVVR